ncbi:unnamed protein product [Withania somnifera]
MDNMLNVHSKKANKQPRTTTKKAVKVVYISNPMKVHTSASEFRALVQQLTGQHANYAATITTFGTNDKKDFYFTESPPPSSDDPQVVIQGDSSTTQVVLPNYVVNNNEGTTTDNSDLSFEDYVPELLENLPSNLWYA